MNRYTGRRKRTNQAPRAPAPIARRDFAQPPAVRSTRQFRRFRSAKLRTCRDRARRAHFAPAFAIEKRRKGESLQNLFDIMAGPALPVWAMTQQLHGASRIAAPAPELRAELSALLVVLVGLLPLISVGCGPPS